jgi:uncharacterized protein (DUF58 family)
MNKPSSHQAITLTQKRLFIAPTQRGFNFVMMTVLLLLIAFIYNNNLVYLLAFLLLSVFSVTLLHTYKSLAGLTIQAGQNTPVYAGENAGFVIHLGNPSPLERPNVACTLADTETIALAPHGKASISLTLPTQKRGWLKADIVTVSSTYPLGFFKVWSDLALDLTTLVYPKPSAFSLPLPDTAGTKSNLTRLQKGADDFYGLSEYQPGDSLKQIHWKAFAKSQGLYSKHYGNAEATELWLDYAQTSGHSTEERISQLCRWLLEAEQAHLVYGFALPGLQLGPALGYQHSRRCLEALALF